MTTIVFALISYVGWAVGDIFAAFAGRKLGGYSTALWTAILYLLIFSFYIPFSLSELAELTPAILVLILVLGAIGFIGVIAFYESFKISNVSLVGTISSSYAIITVLLSIIFLKETINVTQAVSVFIVFLGLILSTLNFKEVILGKFNIDKGILLAIVSAFCFGIYFAFLKIPVREVGWFWPSYIARFMFPLVLLIAVIRNVKFKNLNFKGGLRALLATVIFYALAEFSFNIGISKELVAIVAPIAGSYPTLFVILAFIVFKDRITKQQIIGIITTLVGIVLLSISSI